MHVRPSLPAPHAPTSPLRGDEDEPELLEEDDPELLDEDKPPALYEPPLRTQRPPEQVVLSLHLVLPNPHRPPRDTHLTHLRWWHVEPSLLHVRPLLPAPHDSGAGVGDGDGRPYPPPPPRGSTAVA